MICLDLEDIAEDPAAPDLAAAITARPWAAECITGPRWAAVCGTGPLAIGDAAAVCSL